jgi:hypothetical protein
MHNASGPGSDFSAQGWRHHWRVTLRARRNLPKPGHQPLEHALLLIVIAVAHSGAARVAPDLSRYKQEGNREVASVVWLSSAASVCGSRLNSISRQFKLYANMAS